MSLLVNLALDLFSSFMLDLTGSTPKLAEFLEHHVDGVDILGDILIGQKVCTKKNEARMAIVPALIAHGVEISSPPGMEPSPPVDENYQTLPAENSEY